MRLNPWPVPPLQNMYRNVDQSIGQAMEVNNDLEDFLSQASRGKKSGRGV
jgi:hypothetical protein